MIDNACHELILIRTRNDYNCLMGNSATKSEVELFKVQWRMLHIILNEINKLSMRKRSLSENDFLFGICTSILLQNMTKHSCAVKTTT